ncbi:hypothetical protein SERLA73DRAFT_166961 [Serpula lacrymans var. lacrymans S7.3]|uniref:Uncharacterized protein n=1 Tax=Serpula lacrymans var. lacrymans (strain S7.3) TaxID=936435 RepID=F8PS29_SERL3|nr:hypothetical protein SERLA73DRAFT_166961 [Serpula lacrymans var. lacrymans S7.3]
MEYSVLSKQTRSPLSYHRYLPNERQNFYLLNHCRLLLGKNIMLSYASSSSFCIHRRNHEKDKTLSRPEEVTSRITDRSVTSHGECMNVGH